MKTFLSLFAFSLCILSALSQDLTKDQVQESLTSLRDDIRTYNPALEDYNPNFDEQAVQIIGSLDQGSYSIIEHFKLITELSTISNEGHFALGSWSDSPHQGFGNDTYKYLPLSIQILNGRIYLWNDYSNENQLERGDEIMIINGKSSKEIISQLIRYTPSDGNIVGYAHRSIQTSFNWMYYLYIDQSKTFEISYSKFRTGTESLVTIQPLTNSKLIANYQLKNPTPEPKNESVDDVYELEIQEKYAVLKLKTFYRQLLERYHLKSAKFYQEVFESINDAGCSTLIIDLRNNNGGRKEFANDLVPFIMQIESTDPYLRKSISWSGKEKTSKLPKKNKNSFQGKVVAIVNASTFSAAGSVARFLKEYANAIVVGQETGTRYEGFSGGSKQYVSIPYTDVKIGIPRYQTSFPKSKKQTTSNRGLIPDHIINYTIEDIINDRDLEMDFVIENYVKK
ncbi:S41 family peptidase [Ekhidna sp.]